MGTSPEAAKGLILRGSLKFGNALSWIQPRAHSPRRAAATTSASICPAPGMESSRSTASPAHPAVALLLAPPVPRSYLGTND